MGHVNSRGAIDQNREAKYYALAPAYLTVLQGELLRCENYSGDMPSSITDITNALTVSDTTANEVMPFGLAMYFAMIDRDDAMYNTFAQEYYTNKIPNIRLDEVPITDVYGALDVSMR